MLPDYPMLIGGEAVSTARPAAVRIPYDGAEFARVFLASAGEVDRAIAAAHAAATAMRALTRDERARILQSARAAMLADRETFARAIASESGKPIREAQLEVDRAAATLEFSAEEAHRLAGEVVPMDAHPAGRGRWAMTVREPLGVVAAITPFNFPLNLSVHKIGPAIAAGNAVVHKPASATPVSAILLARVLSNAGLPKGAINVVTGPGGAVGDQLTRDPRVAMVTFTGSAEVGLRIRERAGLKRVTLELGSNSAVIVERDADLELAAARTVAGGFAHSGQVCISVQRVLVQESVRDEYLDRVRSLADALAIGHPLDAAIEVSSLITTAEAARVSEWIAEARGAGAQLVTGAARTGATVTPAVLSDVDAGSAVWSKEAFGPVVAVNRFADLDSAVAAVNASDYGLQAGIFTRDLDRAFHAAREVHVGGFLINDVPAFRADQMPYGGVKLSGTGREGPRYAIEEMTESKLIIWKA